METAVMVDSIYGLVSILERTLTLQVMGISKLLSLETFIGL